MSRNKKLITILLSMVFVLSVCTITVFATDLDGDGYDDETGEYIGQATEYVPPETQAPLKQNHMYLLQQYMYHLLQRHPFSRLTIIITAVLKIIIQAAIITIRAHKATIHQAAQTTTLMITVKAHTSAAVSHM